MTTREPEAPKPPVDRVTFELVNGGGVLLRDAAGPRVETPATLDEPPRLPPPSKA